jgi:hypothetical protein
MHACVRFADRSWRKALTELSENDAAYEVASAALGADPSIGWTKAQFSEWCRNNGLASLCTFKSADKKHNTSTLGVTRKLMLPEIVLPITVSVTLISAISTAASPEPTVDASSYLLSILGTIGTLIYGLLIPLHLHSKLAAADTANVLNAPACRNRYGFLFVRFKPGRWGAEFRILYRKTLQLLVTTLFAEQPYLSIPAQLLVLGWAMWKQYVEHPFAEVGSARRAFVEAHPDGGGWSRGDILEMLSLGAQLVNVALTGVCAFVIRESGAGKDALGVVMCCSAMTPVVYAVRILRQERRGAGRTKGASAKPAEQASPARGDDDLGASLVGGATGATANPLAPA